MPYPALANTDIGRLTSNLSPTGDLWSTEGDTVRQQSLVALGGTFSRLQARANALVIDMFPATAVELLPEWETSLGLPDPCSGPAPTIAQRQMQVVARLTQTDGPSLPSLEAFALALGFTVTITEYVPSRYGQAVYGDPYLEPPWAHAWTLNIEGGSLQSALYGEARFGDRYQTYGDAVLECEMNRLSPAHTVLRFAYFDVPGAEY